MNTIRGSDVSENSMNVIAKEVKFLPDETLEIIYSNNNVFKYETNVLVGVTNYRFFKLQQNNISSILRSEIVEVNHKHNSIFQWDAVDVKLKSGASDSIGIFDKAACAYFCKYLTPKKVCIAKPSCKIQQPIALQPATEAYKTFLDTSKSLANKSFEELDTSLAVDVSKSNSSSPNMTVPPPSPNDDSQTEIKEREYKHIEFHPRFLLGTSTTQPSLTPNHTRGYYECRWCNMMIDIRNIKHDDDCHRNPRMIALTVQANKALFLGIHGGLKTPLVYTNSDTDENTSITVEANPVNTEESTNTDELTVDALRNENDGLSYNSNPATTIDKDDDGLSNDSEPNTESTDEECEVRVDLWNNPHILHEYCTPHHKDKED
jgi:hypothetical protein